MRNGDTRGGVDFVQQADMTAALVLYEKAGVLYPLAGGWGGHFVGAMWVIFLLCKQRISRPIAESWLS